MKNFKISVILPIYNEKENIKVMVNKLEQILGNYFDYEIIFVDDGSEDDGLKYIKDLNSKNSRVQYISLSRNFGQQNALKAGLDYASGDCVVSMDCDLQHPPELVPSMINKWLEGYEIVYTIRDENKNEPFLKRKTASLFYYAINSISDTPIPKGTADYRLLDRKIVEILKEHNESPLFFRGIIPWLGFKQFAMHYAPSERFFGKTKYPVKKMLSFALDGITSFSLKPLRISIFFGYIISLFAFMYASYVIFMKVFTNQAIQGWASVLVSVLFLGGIQLIMVGIVGEYLGRLFMESKRRPNYLIQEKSIN